MKVAAVQHDIVWEDPRATFEHVEPMIAKAAGEGARVVLLTEMYSTGFSMDTDAIAEPVDGASTEFLRTQAQRHGVWVGASLPERPAGRPLPFNQFVLSDPDGVTHRYAKIHPFSYAKEQERFGAGSEHLTVAIDGVRCSLFVCYDLRFADEFWALAHDTDCYFVVANWPESRRDHWRGLLLARAIENQAYVVGVNRVGSGGGLDYVGDSMIIDPFGEVLVEATGEEAVLVADVDPARVTEVRTKYPFLADRR